MGGIPPIRAFAPAPGTQCSPKGAASSHLAQTRQPARWFNNCRKMFGFLLPWTFAMLDLLIYFDLMKTTLDPPRQTGGTGETGHNFPGNLWLAAFAILAMFYLESRVPQHGMKISTPYFELRHLLHTKQNFPQNLFATINFEAFQHHISF